ncbi:MAG: 50S ribosomal protein L30 [Euryarchaeota archaeon]|nr:50S ribosomal protein L30 [Euryarchaeota archaeon]
MTVAVVRIRGGCRTNQDIRDTLDMLRLTRQNHLVLIPEDPGMRGMLQKVKDYVTWGRPDAETVALVIRLRGRLSGGRPITDDYIKENSGYGTAREFADAIVRQKARFSDLKDVTPVIRLHPPRGGYEGTKMSWKAGGSLGDRGGDISALIARMLGPGSGNWPARRPPGRRGLAAKGGAGHA